MKFLRWVALVAVCACVALAQAPSVNTGGVVNAASYAPSNPPGSLITIFGDGMATPGLLLKASSVPLSLHMQGQSDDVSVTVNDKPAPIFYVTKTQSSVQLPWSVAPGSASIVVTRNGSSSQAKPVTIATFSPGIFTINTQGTGAAWVIHNDDYSVSQRAAGWPYPKIAVRPAKAGDILFVYATGLGPVASPPKDGAVPCPIFPACPANYAESASTTTKPTVVINGAPIPAPDMVFSGLTPFYAGVYQLNFRLPPGIPASNATTLEVQIGGVTSHKVTFATQ